jgi:hypothetical protein
MSEVFDKVMKKAAEQKQMAKERKEMRELAGEINSLVIEATPSGLYSVRYSMSGPVPDELKGLFTRRDRIIAIAQRRNIPIEGVA